MGDVQENEETPLIVNDETLSDTLIDDELLPPMQCAMFDMSGMGEQVTLPFEQLEQTETELPMDSILNEIHLGLGGLSDPEQVLEIATKRDLYFPITGEQRVGTLDPTSIPGSTLIIHRGTLLPDELKEIVLSSLRDGE